MLSLPVFNNRQFAVDQFGIIRGSTNNLSLSLSSVWGVTERAWNMRVHTFLLVAAVLSASPVWADIVHLNDGSTINGEIKKAADGWFVTDPHGKVRHITTEEVRSIELAP